MAARRKKTAAAADASTSNELQSTAAATVEESPAETTNSPQEPPFEPTGTYTPTDEENSAAKPEGRGRFRSWVSGDSDGYSKFTDNEQQRLILQFGNKPSEDVITAIKGAGFHFQPDYQGFKQVWVRRNDYEGRLQVEAIEKLIRETGRQSPER